MKVMSRLRAVVSPVLLAVIVGVGLLSLLESYPTKEEWLRGNASSLAKLKITPEMIAKANPWQTDETVFMLQGSRGVIPLGNGGAVYVVTHSAHQNESRLRFLISVPAMLLTGRQRVADATIAVDQQGHLYTCEGHICGYLHLSSKKEVRTLQNFLETYSYGNEKNTWKPYYPE